MSKENETGMNYNETYYFGSAGPYQIFPIATVKKEKSYKPVSIQYNNPYTICYFADGTKIVSKCTEGEKFNPEYGVMSCITKYLYGTRSQFMKTVKKGYDQEIARKIKQDKVENKKLMKNIFGE